MRSSMWEVKSMEHDDKLREYGAVTLLQRVSEKYAERHQISVDEAICRIASTPMYDAIFDYDGTELWKEGPDYILWELERMEEC